MITNHALLLANLRRFLLQSPFKEHFPFQQEAYNKGFVSKPHIMIWLPSFS